MLQKNGLSKKTFLSLLILLIACNVNQVTNENLIRDSEIVTKVKTAFLSNELFREYLSEYEVIWEEGNRGFSKEIDGPYIEYPVQKHGDPVINSVGKTKPSHFNYRLIASQLDGSPKLQLLTFISNSEQDFGNLTFDSADNFSGISYLLREDGKKARFRKYSGGEVIFEGEYLINSSPTKVEEAKYKLGIEECYTVTTYYWQDVYAVFYDGSMVYMYSILLDTTYEETCVTSGTGGTSGNTNTTITSTKKIQLDEYDFLDGPCEEIDKGLVKQTPQRGSSRR